MSGRLSGCTSLRSILALSTMMAAGYCGSVQAQTAPSLLPYTAKLIAGGGPTATFTVGQTCPIAGAPYTATDTYGDGCLATEVQLTGPRYAAPDKTGAIFVSDYTNGLIRRIDPVTGIITVVAGGASSSPGTGTACGTNLSIDAKGDGCLANLVHLSHPTGLVFSPAGDLYFSDYGYSNVRKVAATGGVITTTGVITLVAGNVGGAYGYASGVVAATSSYLQDPYGVGFDGNGNLYIADYYSKANAVYTVNTTPTTDTVTGLSIPAGNIVKIVGAVTGGGATCPNYVSTASPGGCNYGTFVSGALANNSVVDDAYAVSPDGLGDVFFANEYTNGVGKVSSTGVLTLWAGTNTGTGSKLPNTTRAKGPAVAIGSDFGIVSDSVGDVYVTDAYNGIVWRVDAGTDNLYAVAGIGTTGAVCSAATDANGDGCPGLQAKFGIGTGTSGYTTSGIFGITEDAFSDVFVGDTVTNVIREVASGTQFGQVGANQPVQTIEIHYGPGDTPANATPYTLTAGATNFAIGTPTCTYNNADTTTDCLLPITATPSVLGPFTGTLQVTSALGGVGNFILNGTYIQSPVTRTIVALAATTSTCTNTTTYSTTTPISITATLVANGPNPPGGSFVFTAYNGTTTTTLATVNVSNVGTTSAPVYGATTSYTFSTPGTYKITATYSGDTYFHASSGNGPYSITSSAPTFSSTIVTSTTQLSPGCSAAAPYIVGQCTVSAGQTALYSFNIAQNVYSGTLTFACSGLPAGAACSFSPPSITATGCSVSNVVALSITTTPPPVSTASIVATGRGIWSLIGMALGLSLATLIGIRQRRAPLRYGQLWMGLAMLLAVSGTLGCGNGTQGGPATPSGTYSITVTITGTSGTPTTLTVPLVVK